MTTKVDLKKELDGYRATHGRFRVLDIPEAAYLTIDGAGDPNTAPSYASAVAALYAVAYRLKFASRRELGRDYVVMPLEAQWWASDMAAFTRARDKAAWEWTLLMMVPEWIPSSMVDAVALQVADSEERAADLRCTTSTEGLCVQTLHVGPYDEEAEVLAELHERFIPEHGLRMTGRHHEIYLGDPRRADPRRLRPILRQPVERTAD